MSRYCTNCGYNAFGICRLLDIPLKRKDVAKCKSWIPVGDDPTELMDDFPIYDAIPSDGDCWVLVTDLKPKDRMFYGVA